MDLDNLRELKEKAYTEVLNTWGYPHGDISDVRDIPVPPTFGINYTKEFGNRLAIHIPDESYFHDSLVEKMIESTKGESKIKVVGQIEPFGYGYSVFPGLSISHKVPLAIGTLGCFAKEKNNSESPLYILSCNHILANWGNDATKGEVIVSYKNTHNLSMSQPVGFFESYIKLHNLGNGENLVDAAIATIQDREVNNLCFLRGFWERDKIQNYYYENDINDRLVFKIGQRTGLTCGLMEDIEFEPRMPYKKDLICQFKDIINIDRSHFQPQIKPITLPTPSSVFCKLTLYCIKTL